MKKPKDRTKAIDELFLRDVTTEIPSEWHKNLDHKQLPPPRSTLLEDMKPKHLGGVEQGIAHCKEFVAGLRIEEFLAQVGPILSWMAPGDTLDLANPLWADFVRNKFRGDADLCFPEPFDLLRGKTELWENGFQKELRRIWKAAQAFGK